MSEAVLAPQMRSILREIFLTALDQETIGRAIQRYVTPEKQGLRISSDLVPLSAGSKLKVIAMGKAGHTLAEAIANLVPFACEGVVATPVRPVTEVDGLRYFVGGHPLPNRESLAAGNAILETLAQVDDRSQVLYLLSGGGSAAAEKPLHPELTLEDLATTYQALVHCGAPIAEMNAIRKHLSAIKGGRMSQAAGLARQWSLLVSDVPQDTPDALASGPTMPDPTTVDDCYSIAERYHLLPEFTPRVRQLFDRRLLMETPKGSDTAFMRSRWQTILSNASLLAAAQNEANRHGMKVETDVSCDDWDYHRAGDYLLKKLASLRVKERQPCLISGGEVTVKVKGQGRGGRNQQFALSCAERIAGQNIAVLSVGSDGVDGNSPAAGAVVDGTTVARASARGLSVPAALEKFDAFPLLEALGDTVVTGPTGNNLRDLRLLVAW